MSISIAIAGAAGRMGQAIAACAGPDFVITGGSERPGAPSIGLSCGVPSIRFTPERRKEIIAELIEAAEEMSELLSQPVSSD